MNTNKWILLGALAGLAGIAINKQLRLARHRAEDGQPGAGRGSCLDDVPTVQPVDGDMLPRTADDTMRFDDEATPRAPF